MWKRILLGGVGVAVAFWGVGYFLVSQQEPPAPKKFADAMKGEWWARDGDGMVVFLVDEDRAWCGAESQADRRAYEVRILGMAGEGYMNIQLDRKGERLRGSLRYEGTTGQEDRLVIEGLVWEEQPWRGPRFPVEMRRTSGESDGVTHELRHAIQDARISELEKTLDNVSGRSVGPRGRRR